MAQFGKRFRKARKRRQERRSDFLQTFQEQRTERVKARQTGKTDRSGFRNMRKADVVRSKAEGGYFLPQSVQARQDTITSGIGLVGKAGMMAMGIPPLGFSNGGQSSPYGGGFATSGFEDDFYSPEIAGNTGSIIPGVPDMALYVVGGGALLYILTRKK